MKPVRAILDDFKKLMDKSGIDYYIVPTSDPHMSEYICNHYKGRAFLSGFTGDAGLLMVGLKESGLWTDGRFYTQAEMQLKGSGIKLFKSGMKEVPTLIEYLDKNVKKGECIGVDGFVISSSMGSELKGIAKRNKAKFKIDIDLLEGFWEEREATPKKPVHIIGEGIFGKSISDKVESINKICAENGVDGYLLTRLDEIMWTFNLRGSDIQYSPVSFSYAYISKKENVLFLQREVVTEALLIYAMENDFIIRPYDEVFKYIKKIKKSNCVGISYRYTNYAIYKCLKKNCSIKDVYSPVEILKAVKNETEINYIKEFFRRDSAALINGLYQIDKAIANKEKLTEIGVSKLLYKCRSKIPGFIEESFPTIAGFKENGAIIHYEPNEKQNKRIEGNGLLVIDSGGQYECATTDVTRTIVVGNPTKEEKRHFTAVTMGMLRLMNLKFPEGCIGRNLDLAARERLWKEGLDFNHGTGHGVGCCLNVHEGPQAIRQRASLDDKYGELKPGMLITDEPGFYEPGKYGIRSENTLLVEKYKKTEYGQFLGFRPLTMVHLDIKGFDTDIMTEEDIGLVNSYQKQVFEAMTDLLDDEVLDWLKDRLFLCYSN